MLNKISGMQECLNEFLNKQNNSNFCMFEQEKELNYKT